MHQPTEEPTEEQLFDRYRRKGDLDALGEVFDRTAPALLRVAVHLAQDPATAEDLVQVTFLKAIESAADYQTGRPLVPWLTGILRHRAAQRRWRDRRPLDPERVHQPRSPALDPAAQACERELTEAVDSAIAALPEQYRAVLRLRLRYGHHPAEIAYALDRSPGTVRSQLARGLDLLRQKLPQGLAGALGLGLLPGRGLAAVRTAVIGHAAAYAGAAAVAVPPIAAVAAGVLLMKTSIVVAAAVLVACGVWVAWPGGEMVSPPSGDGAERVGSSSGGRRGEPKPASASGNRTEYRAVAAGTSVEEAPELTPIQRLLRDLEGKEPDFRQLLHPTLTDVDLASIAEAVAKHRVTVTDLRRALQEQDSGLSEGSIALLTLGMAFAKGFTDVDVSFLEARIGAPSGEIGSPRSRQEEFPTRVLGSAHVLRLRGRLCDANLQKRLSGLVDLALAHQAGRIQTRPHISAANAVVVDMVLRERGRRGKVDEQTVAVARSLLGLGTVGVEFQIGAWRALFAANGIAMLNEMYRGLAIGDATAARALAFAREELDIGPLVEAMTRLGRATINGGGAGYAFAGLLSIGTHRSVKAGMEGLATLGSINRLRYFRRGLHEILISTPPEAIVPGLVLLADENGRNADFRDLINDLQRRTLEKLRAIHLSPAQRGRTYDRLEKMLSGLDLGPSSARLAMRVLGQVGRPGDIARIRELGRLNDVEEQAESAVQEIEARRPDSK